MVSFIKTGWTCGAFLLLPLVCGTVQAAPPASVRALPPAAPVQVVDAPSGRFKMVEMQGKDVSGKVYKKLGLPSLQYCWDTCVREAQCTGARWGVIQGDVAGLCLLLSGDLSVKESVHPTTEDGKAIQVIAGRKQPLAASEPGT